MDWHPIDDVVMGGVSQSALQPYSRSVACFGGVVSLEHGGGFASVRTEPRKWNTAGLNEFRKHFGLKPYETFEDINSDPGVAESLRHLAIGVDEAAKVLAEAVLVELVAGLDVPQPAIVRADLVGQHDPHLVVFPQPAELDLEVHEGDADAHEEAGEEVVHPERAAHPANA